MSTPYFCPLRLSRWLFCRRCLFPFRRNTRRQKALFGAPLGRFHSRLVPLVVKPLTISAWTEFNHFPPPRRPFATDAAIHRRLQTLYRRKNLLRDIFTLSPYRLPSKFNKCASTLASLQPKVGFVPTLTMALASPPCQDTFPPYTPKGAILSSSKGMFTVGKPIFSPTFLPWVTFPKKEKRLGQKCVCLLHVPLQKQFAHKATAHLFAVLRNKTHHFHGTKVFEKLFDLHCRHQIASASVVNTAHHAFEVETGYKTQKIPSATGHKLFVEVAVNHNVYARTFVQIQPFVECVQQFCGAVERFEVIVAEGEQSHFCAL